MSQSNTHHTSAATEVPASTAAAINRWTFLSNHAHVLVALYANPDLVLREIRRGGSSSTYQHQLAAHRSLEFAWFTVALDGLRIPRKVFHKEANDETRSWRQGP